MARSNPNAAQIPIEQESPELLDAIMAFKDDPLGFVMFIFPWGQPGTPLAEADGPDYWQVLVLRQIAQKLRDNKQRAIAEAIRIAVASGHGIGKTALIAWIILWFMSTREDPQIVCTATTKTQLDTKTWRELAKWHKLAKNEAWFRWTATQFYMQKAPSTWMAAAVPWSKEKPDAFAGTHEKHVLMVYDEASGVDDVIWEATEGAMTTPGAIWIVFGNPVRNTGRFRQCWSKFRHRWDKMKVDSRTAKMANREEIQKWIDDYGEDSDFVRIRVKGEFPRASTSQLITEEQVRAAAARRVIEEALEAFPRILGVDVARFGDDQTVIVRRQGPMMWKPKKYRELDIVANAEKVISEIIEFQPDAVFVDAAGLGAGVPDVMRRLGHDVIDALGAHRAGNDKLYYNKRAEMWALMGQWIEKEACLPDGEDFDDDLLQDLISPEYGFDGKGRMQLESKRDMKRRGLPSPDTADALANTFYMPVAKANVETAVMQKLRAWESRTRGGTWMGS